MFAPLSPSFVRIFIDRTQQLLWRPAPAGSIGQAASELGPTSSVGACDTAMTQRGLHPCPSNRCATAEVVRAERQTTCSAPRQPECCASLCRVPFPVDHARPQPMPLAERPVFVVARWIIDHADLLHDPLARRVLPGRAGGDLRQTD